MEKNNIGKVGLEALVAALNSDETIRHVALSQSDLRNEFAVPTDFIAGRIIRTLSVHRNIKYAFLLSIEKSPEVQHLYLPPEIVRIIFSYLISHIHRTISIK